MIARRQMGQEETPPHPGYPHYNALQPGDDIIPIRDGGMETNEQGTYICRYKNSKYLKANII